MIKAIGTDLLVKRALRIVCEFSKALAGQFVVGETYKVQMANRKKPMKVTVQSAWAGKAKTVLVTFVPVAVAVKKKKARKKK